MAVDIELALDSMGVVTAVTAPRPKPPAEHSLLPHVLWLRDLLCSGQLKALSWEDTRDMVADGLTKGSVDRGSLQAAAGGERTREHTPYVVSLTPSGSLVTLQGRAPSGGGGDASEE